MKILRKLLLAAVIAGLLTALPAGAALNAAAAYNPDSRSRGEFDSLLVLGDSISTGYGLPGASSKSCDSYANLLARELGLFYGNYDNYAVNGATSNDLRNSVPMWADRIAAADVIVVSIGGNDVLSSLLNTIATSLNINSGNLASIKQYVGSTDLTSALAALNDSAVTQLYETIAATFRGNLLEIAGRLRSLNADARIIFIGLYNPLDGVKEFEPLLPFTNSVIKNIDAITRENAEACGYEMLDIYGDFAGRGPELTNISNIDIHPNAAGHGQIYNLLSAALEAGLPELPPETEPPETAPETTAPPDGGAGGGNIVVYIIAGAAIIGGAAAGYFISRSKNKNA